MLFRSSNFIGQFSSGLIVKLSLNITGDIADSINMDGSFNEQLQGLMEALGTSKTVAEKAAKQPIHEVGACVTKYFHLLERVMQHHVGELKRASLGE